MSHQLVALLPKFWSDLLVDILSTSLLKGVRTYIGYALFVALLREKCVIQQDQVKSVDLGIWRYQYKQCNVSFCITSCCEIFHTKQEPFLAHKRMKSAEANCNTEEWYDITLLLSVGVCIYSEAINFVSYFALLLDTCTCTCMYKYNHEQQSLRSKLIHKTAQFNNS